MVCPRQRLRLVFAAWVLLLAGAVGAIAQPPLTITPSGYYLTFVDADGVPSLVQITTVIDLTGGNPSPDTPDGPIDAEFAKQVKEWSDDVDDPQTAQAIAWVYLHVGDALDADQVDATSVWLALKQATDAAIKIVDGGDWSAFREKLSSVITESRQRGTLQTSKEIRRMLASAQHGLELSADGSDALTMAQTAAITAKTNEAIDAAK